MSRNDINNGGGKTGAGEQHVVKRFLAGLLSATACAMAFANVAPTVDMTSPRVNAAFIGPASITLSATAADSDGSISKVAFYRGTTLLTTVTVPPYTWSWTNVAAGSYSITAKATDNLGTVTTSAPLAVMVNVNALPTVSLTAPVAGGDYIAPATIALAAIAADTDGTIAKVSYYRDTTWIGTATTAPYTFDWTNAPVGTYSVTARATDDKGGLTISSPVSVVVKPNILPAVSLLTPSNNATFAAPGYIPLTATASDSDGTISKVAYFHGTTQIGSVTVAPYTLNWGNVVVGTYSLTAHAIDNKGGATVSAPVLVTVNPNVAPTVSLTSPANNASFVGTANIVLTASAADGDGTITKVNFYRNGTLIGTSTVAPFKYTWVTATAGTFSMTAAATDNKGAVGTSAPVSVTVTNNIAPSVILTAPVANANLTAPASITLAADATDSDGTITRVDFYSGTTLITSDNAAPYNFNWANVASGTYSVTAKATDDKGAVKTSLAVAVVVRVAVVAPVPTVSISAPASNTNYIAPASFTLTANAAVTGDTISKVDYISGANVVGTATVAPYAVSLTNIGVGTYTVHAKATGSLGGTATSAPVVLVVNANAAPVIALDASPASSTAPATITLNATASDSDGSIAKVEFFNGTTLLATVTQGPYRFVWNGVAADSYQLTARATDNLGAVTTSLARTVTVTGQQSSTQVFYIYSDQINTAREITNAAGVKVWEADPDPFGANLPNENPAGQGMFSYNPRFPGQYYDRETGLHYNYYRDYDPQTGRYVQSDPIGLGGGINTYSYGLGNPLRHTDPTGEVSLVEGLVVVGVIGIAMIIQSQNSKKKPYANDHSPWSPDPAVNNDFIGDRDALKDANYVKVPYNDPNKPDCNELQKRIDDINKELQMRENFNNKWYAGLFNGGHATRVERLTSERDKLVARKNRGDCTPCP